MRTGTGDTLQLTGDTVGQGGDELDGLRALCVAHWTTHPDGAPPPHVTAGDDRARAALDRWRLGG